MEVADFLKVTLSAEASEFSRCFLFPKLNKCEWRTVERDDEVSLVCTDPDPCCSSEGMLGWGIKSGFLI